jgi:HSP20 family protein
MNLLKIQNPDFNSLFDELIFNQDWKNQKLSLPAVNIIEADDHFDIQLATPGMKKSDFKIEVEEGVLIISSDTHTKSNEAETSFTRKEFGYHSFKRSFNIPDTIYVDRISATYKEGILTVSLPKKEEALPQPKKLVSIK